MATRNLTAADFDKTVDNNDIVLIDFWAEWCGPCKMFAPVYEAASEKHTDIIFGKVDTETETQLGHDFDIRSIPTLVAIREGIVVHYQAGAIPPAALEELIQTVRNLDMEDVRRQAA